METILKLIENNYLIITIIACFLILSLIGYLSEIIKNKDVIIKHKEETVALQDNEENSNTLEM